MTTYQQQQTREPDPMAVKMPEGVKIVDSRFLDERTLEFVLESETAKDIFQARQQFDNADVRRALEVEARNRGMHSPSVDARRHVLFIVDQDGNVIAAATMEPNYRFRCTYVFHDTFPT